MIERGDIFYADFSLVPGAGEGGLRPVLIIQTDVGMRYSPTVIAVEITSKIPQTLLSTQVKIDASESGLSNDSVILLEQIRTLDKQRLKEKIGHLDKQIMQDVDAAVFETLGYVEKNEMIINKKLMDIIGEDEYQMCIDLGRQIINCPICGNETFDDWFICPYCNWQAEILHYEDEYSPANKSTIEEYRKKYLSENHTMIEKNSNYKIENGVFSGFSTAIHIPSGVKQIAPLALAPLANLQCLVLPDTLEKFEPSCLRKSYDVMTKDIAMSWGISSHPEFLKEIHICENHSIYQSKNGVLYSADGKQLIYLPPSRHSETVEIAEGVYELCEESCCFVSAKEIIFPKSLRRILDRACCSSNLKASLIPACEIGESAFQGCVLPEFTEIYNRVIPAKAFANCSNVKMIRLHDSVKLVKNEAFSYTKIEKIYIPSSTRIEENAFVHEVQKWVESHVVKVHESGWKQMESTYETYLENNKDIIIGGEAGSPAEAFANANGIKFEVVGSSDEEIKAWFGCQERIDESCGSGVFYETSDGELVEYDKDNLPF